MRALALSGLMLSVCTLACPAIAPSAFAQSPTERLIPVNQRAHDFGAVARAAKTEHRFEITNPFQQPLHLASISASCGCTTPIIETEWIQPGETGTVLARFNTGTFTGDRKATLNLTIDKPNFMQLQLNVKGYIRTDIVINPGELNFGTVSEGESKEIEATIEYAGRSDWKLTGVSSNAEFINATLEETSRSAGRVAYKIKATLAPGADAGTQATQLTLFTNDNRLKSVPLTCLAQIQAPLTVSPTNVALGEMKPGQPIQQRLLVKGTQPFQIVDISAPNMQVRFDQPEEAKAIQFLNLTLIPDENMPAGQGQTPLTIITDMDGEREVTINMSYKVLVTTEKSEPQPLSDKVSSRAREMFLTK